MYAGRFPSAHSFNSSVFANVKFAVREIEVPTGELKWNLSSPAWMAVVASAIRRPCTVFFMASQLAAAGQKITSSNLAERTTRCRHRRGSATARLANHPDYVTMSRATPHITASRRFTFRGACSNARNSHPSPLRFLAPLRVLLARRSFRRKAIRQAPKSRRAHALHRLHGRGLRPALPGKPQLGPAQSSLPPRQIVDRLARQRSLCRGYPLRHLGPSHHWQRLERRSAN